MTRMISGINATTTGSYVNSVEMSKHPTSTTITIVIIVLKPESTVHISLLDQFFSPLGSSL
jgi:hypothetical protein